MTKTTWIEVNIHLKQYHLSTIVLFQIVNPLVRRLQGKYHINSWHFFFEPEIRLRFLADVDTIEKIRREVDTTFSNLERKHPSLFEKHSFGCHGIEGKIYPGEASSYGELWEKQYKVWETSANIALSLSNPLNSRRAIEFHTQRLSHLILNQFGYTRFQEFLFHLKFAFLHLKLYLRGERR